MPTRQKRVLNGDWKSVEFLRAYYRERQAVYRKGDNEHSNEKQRDAKQRRKRRRIEGFLSYISTLR